MLALLLLVQGILLSLLTTLSVARARFPSGPFCFPPPPQRLDYPAFLWHTSSRITPLLHEGAMRHHDFLASEYAPAAPEAAAFHVIPAPLEQSTSYGGGTARGPAAILAASQQLEAWDGISAPCEGGVYTAPAVTCATNEEALTGIEQAVATALAHKALPVLLGGEHTVTLGALRALAREARRNGTPFGVVQIDAHADLRPSYEGNPLSHASVMYRAVADLELPLAQFAMRDYCREEAAIRRRFQITAIDAAVLHDRGIPEQPLPAGFPSHIYITFDVDGLDASLMPATGTPSPGGLFWYDALRLIERCCRGRRVVGMDVVELAPLPGLHHADFTAAKLTHALMGFAQRANAAPI